ncbi:hypothetical protein [Pantoea sp. 18069]|uniref:hypothetical protein n=1 Tax=Pantoea sp. 18069 TaxID=2681415 RepID=UPI00135AD763|nr:hypothetical protein [Pantoea sp. 18069]
MKKSTYPHFRSSPLVVLVTAYCLMLAGTASATETEKEADAPKLGKYADVMAKLSENVRITAERIQRLDADGKPISLSTADLVKQSRNGKQAGAGLQQPQTAVALDFEGKPITQNKKNDPITAKLKNIHAAQASAPQANTQSEGGKLNPAMLASMQKRLPFGNPPATRQGAASGSAQPASERPGSRWGPVEVPVQAVRAPVLVTRAVPALPDDHVELAANDSLVMKEGPSSSPQKSLVLTNHLGNTHGVLVEEDKLVLSGGLHSTNLRLDDDGAAFADSQTGAAVVVSGVAAGIAPTDATNVGQVQELAQGVVDAAVAPLGARIDGVEGRVQQLDQKINAVEKKLSGGVAMALALSQPVSFAPKSDTAVTGGVATYNGQTAMGFSFNRLVANTETRRTVVSMGVAATTSGRSSACARVGACFSW